MLALGWARFCLCFRYEGVRGILNMAGLQKGTCDSPLAKESHLLGRVLLCYIHGR